MMLGIETFGMHHPPRAFKARTLEEAATLAEERTGSVVFLEERHGQFVQVAYLGTPRDAAFNLERLTVSREEYRRMEA